MHACIGAVHKLRHAKGGGGGEGGGGVWPIVTVCDGRFRMA